MYWAGTIQPPQSEWPNGGVTTVLKVESRMYFPSLWQVKWGNAAVDEPRHQACPLLVLHRNPLLLPRRFLQLGPVARHPDLVDSVCRPCLSRRIREEADSLGERLSTSETPRIDDEGEKSASVGFCQLGVRRYLGPDRSARQPGTEQIDEQPQSGTKGSAHGQQDALEPGLGIHRGQSILVESYALRQRCTLV